MGLNKSTAMFIFTDKCRGIACSYEPGSVSRDDDGNITEDSRTGLYTYKSLDPDIKVGDYVIVPTDTRHKLTVVKVEDVDVEPDYDSNIIYKWIVGRVALKDHEALVAQENDAIKMIQRAEKRKRRIEIKKDVEDLLNGDVNQIPFYESKDDNTVVEAPSDTE